MTNEVYTQRARRFGADRVPELPGVDEFWRPADAPGPGWWIVRNGLMATARAKGVDFGTATAVLAARLGIPRKAVLTALWRGFVAVRPWAFSEAVEDAEGKKTVLL